MQGDEYGSLSGVLNTLLLAYSRVRTTSNHHSKEHGQRRGIDDTIELAFSGRTDRHCEFKYVLSLLAVETRGVGSANVDERLNNSTKLAEL